MSEMTYRWQTKDGEVVARVVAYGQRPGGGRRLFLRDANHGMWIADPADDGGLSIVVGPVTVAQAVEAAGAVALGTDHGPIARTMLTLAAGLVGLATADEVAP